jgi:hypothetical protein
MSFASCSGAALPGFMAAHPRIEMELTPTIGGSI